MAYNNRPLSPGGKRIQNANRASDSRVNDVDQYGSERHNSYTSPRSSAGGVIPISTETFVNYPPAQSDRSSQQRYDSYSGRSVDSYSTRPRGNSYADSPRQPTSSTSQSSARNPPKIVQSEHARPLSPQKGTQSKEYYVTPAITKEPRKEGISKKVYSLADGKVNLVADVNMPSERHHRRRESNGVERGGYRNSTTVDSDRGRRGYHLNGPARSKDKSIDDDDAFSYTDPIGMFRETEPRWRDREARPRRNSIDRVGGGSRERPVSMMDPAIDPRRPNAGRDVAGPPPSMRGWDKLNEAVSRSNTVRERVPQSPTRARDQQYASVEARIPQSPTRGRYVESSAYGNPRDPYYVPPRMPSVDDRDRRYAPAPYDHQDHFEIREPRPQERRNSMTRMPDHSVERRGFGIRADSRDRYGRGSNESFTRDRDPAYPAVESHRHYQTADPDYYDELRSDQDKWQDKWDRPVDRSRAEDRERQRERDGRERDQKSSHDDQRRYSRDVDYDLDSQRVRDRDRMMQPPPERERHHHRHNSYQERDYDRKPNGPRDSGDSIPQPGLSSAAVGGLAAVTAAYGASSFANKKDERDVPRDRDEDYLPDRSREKGSQRPTDLRRPPDNRSGGSHSDDGGHAEKDRDLHRSADSDRGLGFAFEPAVDAPKPPRDRPTEHPTDRDFERTHGDPPPLEPPVSASEDPDEEYRRRLEKMQRELGHGSGDRAVEPDPDRERRKRERIREREYRDGGESSVTGPASTYTDTSTPYPMPGGFDDDDTVVDSATGSARPRELRRRPSILDEPMANETAHIIDNSLSEKREDRVRIVDPPTEEEEKRPKSILKKPTEKFPEHPDEVREGVASIRDTAKTGIPAGARWTKIHRRLVNPEALEAAKERFEERLDFVIVLRVLTKEEIQKLADRTKEIRDERFEAERRDRRAARRRERNHERREHDEYEDEDSEDEFKPRAPKLLEAPS